MGEIRALCISEKRGMEKYAMDRVFFMTEHGIDGDADAGDQHSQVHLIGLDEIDNADGMLGGNVAAEGFQFKELPLGTRLRVGPVFLEITQIGKECHNPQPGSVMPHEGAFARVLHGGWVTVGDQMEITAEPIPLDAAVITVSDEKAAGALEDRSGTAIREALTEAGYAVAGFTVMPDEKAKIARELTLWADRGVGLVLMTGSTEDAVHDVASEAARMRPDIPAALRAAAGIRKRTLIVNLPDSETAVRESLNIILPELRREIEILRGDTGVRMQ